MIASAILATGCFLLVLATLLADLFRNRRMTISQRTWLVVAAIFALVSAVLQLIWLP